MIPADPSPSPAGMNAGTGTKGRIERMNETAQLEHCAICGEQIEENNAYLDAAGLAPYNHLSNQDQEHEAIPQRFANNLSHPNTARERNAILAALRLWQQVHGHIPWPSLINIATDGGTSDPLTSDEIDRLCERLNVDQTDAPEVAVFVEGGMVQEVLANQPLNVLLIDQDIETADAEDIHHLPHGGEATIDYSPATITNLSPYLALLHEQPTDVDHDPADQE